MPLDSFSSSDAVYIWGFCILYISLYFQSLFLYLKVITVQESIKFCCFVEFTVSIKKFLLKNKTIEKGLI